jgi:hypothetical protein
MINIYMKYLLYICFFLLIVLFFSYINSKPKESFISKIRGFYRPIIRRTRLVGEGFSDQIQNQIKDTNRNFNKFLEKLGFN